MGVLANPVGRRPGSRPADRVARTSSSWRRRRRRQQLGVGKGWLGVGAATPVAGIEMYGLSAHATRGSNRVMKLAEGGSPAHVSYRKEKGRKGLRGVLFIPNFFFASKAVGTVPEVRRIVKGELVSCNLPFIAY